MQIFRYTLIFCLFIGFLSSCSTSEDTPPADNTTNPTPAPNIDKTKLLQLVNALRQQGCTCGTKVMPAVGALVWHTLLEKAATDHSKDMNDKNYFSHTSQDGRNPGQRIIAAGYTWTSYGENIAKGYANEDAVVQGWRNSPGHCENMMGASFTEMGVGKVGDYWTQVFGSR